MQIPINCVESAWFVSRGAVLFVYVFLKEEEKLNLANDTNQNNPEVTTEFAYKPAELDGDSKETQEILEGNDGDNPSVFGSNTPDGNGFEEVMMSDEEEDDIPSFMRRKK